MESERLKQENNYLKGEKRKLEEDLEVERCQKAKIENKLKVTMARNWEFKKKLQKANTEMNKASKRTDIKRLCEKQGFFRL